MKLSGMNRQQNFILISILFFIYGVENFCKEQNLNISSITKFKNIWLIIITLFFLYELFYIWEKKKEYKLVFIEETKSIICLAVTFTILSLWFVFKNEFFVKETIVGLFKLLLPILVAFVLMNIMEIADIYRMMEICLIIMLFFYAIANLQNFNISSIKSINFIESYSPFESHFFSPPAMALCIFFCYYRKKKWVTLLSVIFSVMTFKRLMIIYAIFIFAVGETIKKWKPVPRWLIRIFMVTFIFLSWFYTQLMMGNIEDLFMVYLGISMNAFTMGRSWFMSQLLTDFTSYGFMSSTVGYTPIEMDIPMVYVEMGILAVIATVYFITKLCRNNWYNFFTCVFLLANLLTAHWFDVTYFWILNYVTIGAIAYKTDNIEITKKKRRIKFVFR